MIKNILKNPTNNKEDLIAAIIFIIKTLIDDKTTTVLVGTLELFGLCLKKLKPKNNAYLSPMISTILEKLADMVGHNNETVRKTAESVFLELPNYYITQK